MREKDMVDFRRKYSGLWKVIEEISKRSMFQKKALLGFMDLVELRYFEFAEDLVKRMLKVLDQGECYDYLAEIYLWYTKTIRIEELFFAKEGRYRLTEYEEVYDKVYGRDEYMFDYVIGLGMTQIFWPNHWQIMLYFLDEFLPRVESSRSGAEVGVGHGIFHSELLRGCPNLTSKLLDVSPVSLEMTQKMIMATGLDMNRAEPILCDIQQKIPIEDGSLDALLMGELIEHIEKGEEVLTGMANKMKKTGFCFFTTAANSPAEDHILLFKTIGEIRDFIDRTGWRVLDEHLGTLRNMTVEEAEKEGHNINYAAILAIE